jgi:hypothetical protein
MKTLKTTILIGLISFSSFAQSFNFMDISYEEKGKTMVKIIETIVVIERPGSPKELQQDITNWIHDTYKNPYAVINFERDGFILIKDVGKGFIQFIPSEPPLDCTYFLGFRFKEGRIEVELEDLTVMIQGKIRTYPTIQVSEKGGKPYEYGLNFINSLQNGLNGLIDSIKTYEASTK